MYKGTRIKTASIKCRILSAITDPSLSGAFTVSIRFLNESSSARTKWWSWFISPRIQWMMALRLRGSKDVKKSFYYVWYLGAREAKGVDAMPGAIAYLLERERLQEPFKVTLQVSGTILKSGFGSARRKYLKRGNELNADAQSGLCAPTPILYLFSSLIPIYVPSDKNTVAGEIIRITTLSKLQA